MFLAEISLGKQSLMLVGSDNNLTLRLNVRRVTCDEGSDTSYDMQKEGS